MVHVVYTMIHGVYTIVHGVYTMVQGVNTMIHGVIKKNSLNRVGTVFAGSKIVQVNFTFGEHGGARMTREAIKVSTRWNTVHHGAMNRVHPCCLPCMCERGFNKD